MRGSGNDPIQDKNKLNITSQIPADLNTPPTFTSDGIQYGDGGLSSVDVGGWDPGVDAMGQATGQDFGD